MKGTTGTTGANANGARPGSGGEAPGVENVVRAIIHEIARQETTRIGRDDDLVAVLGVDSLQGLQVLAGVEKRFGVRLPDEELIQLRTIGRIADAVRRQQDGARVP
jgi:acyl carrier protein